MEGLNQQIVRHGRFQDFQESRPVLVTVAGRFGIDTFGVGMDAGATVSKAYRPPFAYTGTIDRVVIEIGEPGLDPDEEAKLHARFTAGKEY